MKKLYILLCLVFVPLFSDAQGTKKVAILEVVDKEGMLTYSQKVLLKNTIARAIANTEGYEAYDRTEIDAIMREHDFQRSGLVSTSEIRKLDEMKGVSLILVTEGVLIGNEKLFVSAKVINIETERVEMMDNITMGINSEEMRQGCEILIKRMIGVSASTVAKEEAQRKQSNTRAITASTFIPGMGQMLKGQLGAGSVFLATEVALFGCGTTFYFLSQNQLKTMQASSTTYEEYAQAKKKKGNYDIVMGTCFGIGVALHVANMVHAWCVKDKHLSSNLNFIPAIIPTNEYSRPNYAMGACVQIKF